jgi:hypothetical protein
MNKCKPKIKHTCGTKVFATCVEYETELPEFSEIDDCPTIEETTEELYTLVGESQLEGLGELCLEYVKTEEDKIIVSYVLAKFEEEICNLKEQVETLSEPIDICSLPITECGLDLKCITDACNEDIQTFGQLVQAMIDKICEDAE